MNNFRLTISAVALCALSLVAQAKPVQQVSPSSLDCAASDLGLAGGNGFACAGYVEGNLLNEANSAAAAALLASLGLSDWTGQIAEKIELGGGSAVDFSTPLFGTTWVGIHKGKAGPNGVEGTAFYKFDAGTDLNSFKYLLAGSSGAVLYSTGKPTTPDGGSGGGGSGNQVPEPSSLLLLAAALGAAGLTAKRRRSAR